MLRRAATSAVIPLKRWTKKWLRVNHGYKNSNVVPSVGSAVLSRKVKASVNALRARATACAAAHAAAHAAHAATALRLFLVSLRSQRPLVAVVVAEVNVKDVPLPPAIRKIRAMTIKNFQPTPEALSAAHHTNIRVSPTPRHRHHRRSPPLSSQRRRKLRKLVLPSSRFAVQRQFRNSKIG